MNLELDTGIHLFLEDTVVVGKEVWLVPHGWEVLKHVEDNLLDTIT